MSNDQEPKVYPAEDVRQGKILLKTKFSRAIFIGALAAFLVIAMAIYWL